MTSKKCPTSLKCSECIAHYQREEFDAAGKSLGMYDYCRNYGNIDCWTPKMQYEVVP